MKRKIFEELKNWKESATRKPLVVNGARQVGKTFAICQFGQEQYEQFVHIDFSAQPQFAALFEGDITPTILLEQLQVLADTNISAGNTLLFFDEVQACPRALTSLKYFYEQAPQYHVVAAGSLLGVALGRQEQSFPVGKVQTLAMHPMDFEEFLWAQGQERLAQLIRKHAQSGQRLAVHEKALELYRSYLVVGGMPEVVQAHVDGAALGEVRALQLSLTDAYLADMAKYARPVDTARLLNVWRGVPEQLAKANHKFQYTTIASSARAHQYEAAINWLEAAGLVHFCYRTKQGVRPLAAHVERDYFKLYLLDTGLLGALMGVEPQDLLALPGRPQLNANVRGGIAENFVMQQLVACGAAPLYWGTASRLEVDFVLDMGQAGVVPVEVKSGKNVSAQSLNAFVRQYAPERVVRISTKNFGSEGGVTAVPLYAAFCIGV